MSEHFGQVGKWQAKKKRRMEGMEERMEEKE